MTETLSPALPTGLEADIHDVLKMLFERHLTIATAESCTGGLVSALLTDVDGYGQVFERGFVVYTEAAKTEMLGVDRAILETEGAVSKATATAMAHGALDRSKADVVIAVTGFAGPAGPGDTPGLIHFACARRNGWFEHRREEFGPQARGAARISALRTIMAMLRRAIAQA